MTRIVAPMGLVVLILVSASVVWAAVRDPTTTSQGPAQPPQVTAFTYQGYLKDVSGPVDSACDFLYGLFATPTGPEQIGKTVSATDVPVDAGIFTSQLDFGGGAFDGSERYLQVAVRCPAGSGEYTTLSPRQPLTPAPQAVYASSAGTASWEGLVDVPEDVADGDDDTLASLSCSNGQTLVWQDSEWMCADTTNMITGLATEQVFSNTDVTIGADGLGLVGYHDGEAPRTLWVAHCDNLRCTSATLTELDSTPDISGLSLSIAIGADGFGLISHFVAEDSVRHLRVTHCEDTACTSAVHTTLDSNVGHSYSSLTIGADGLGLISYYDSTNGDLKVAHCDNTACTSATVSTVDSVGEVGRHNSITIGQDGLGLISYFDVTNGDLKVVHCEYVICSTATTAMVDSGEDAGEGTSITIGSDGLGLISYRAGHFRDLKVAHCNDIRCTSATTTLLDLGGGIDTSIAIGADGAGLISFLEQTTEGQIVSSLHVAHCIGDLCGSATISSIEGGGRTGQGASIAIGEDGLALISYRGSDRVAPQCNRHRPR